VATLSPDNAVKRLVRRVTPARIYAFGRRRVLTREARRFRDAAASHGEIPRMVDEALASLYFRPDQKRTEIIQLLQLVRERDAKRICEIGGRMGGTLALFAQAAAADAQLLSIDLAYLPGQREALAAFARPRQRIVCVAADSHSEGASRQVAEWLRGDRLDVLFIDGDHSFAGVSDDFARYSPLVRPGGIVAFHDVCPDSRTRHGIRTAADTGEVPRFWASLKPTCARTSEFIEEPAQDGCGIGVVYWQ
jgi:predicted O-methyltransferase YrrM